MPSLEQLVFGLDDPKEIAGAVSRFCERELGSPLVGRIFYTASVGCVAGVELADGRAVVVKAYQQRWTRDFLAAVRRVQGVLAGRGFPCPEPIAGPAALGEAWALVESFRADPGQAAPTPEMMRASAEGLALQVQLARDVDASGLQPHPFVASDDGLYPEPHSPIFDFRATHAGAGWIDDLARAGSEARDSNPSPSLIAHTDWSARNVRLAPDRVLVAYDWDSLAVVPETTAVGQAAATWSAFGTVEDDVAPSPTEVAEFVNHYETARGAPFTQLERRAAAGAALYVLAYTARCEHSIDPGEQARGWARSRLRKDGDRFVSPPGRRPG